MHCDSSIQHNPLLTVSLLSLYRLVLMSRKDAGAHAATLVFLLRSTVNTRAPLKRIRTEGPLYDLQSFDFTVANPFPADGDFTVTLLHEPAEAQLNTEVEVGKKGARAVTKASATHTAGVFPCLLASLPARSPTRPPLCSTAAGAREVSSAKPLEKHSCGIVSPMTKA